MKQPSVFITTATGLALLAIAVGLFALGNGSDSRPANAAHSRSARTPDGEGMGNPDKNRTDASGPVTASKERTRRPVSSDAELVAKYGESRTKLARKVLEDKAAIQEDMLALMSSGVGPFAPKDPATGLQRLLGEGYAKLNLTEDQKKKAEAAYSSLEARSLAKVRETIEDSNKNPDRNMDFMLAGDAFKRGKITAADYDQARAEFQQAGGVDMNSGALSQTLAQSGAGDPAFRAEIEATLDSNQQQAFEEVVAARQQELNAMTAKAAALAGPMDLEQLDQMTASGRKALSSLKGMMESGAGTILKDAK